MPSPRRLPAALPAALVLLGLAPPAEAYLDPGTGSIVLQAAIAAVAAAGVALKLYWTRIRALFGRKPPAPEEEKRTR